MRFFVVLLFFGLVSCQSRPSSEVQTEELSSSSLTFSQDSLVKSQCEGESCASLRLIWPVAQGPKEAAEINQTIEDRLTDFLLFGDVISKNRDTLILDYFQSFTEFKGEFPDAPGGWEIEVEGTPTYQSDSTISILFSWMSYMGGAHPNHGQDFLNFQIQSGDFLSVDQLVRDEKELLKIVEQKFREFHEVASDVSLADDGRFFLPETGFFLANAMGFKEGKFWVIYVPYEIGPYAMGYTELAFTKEELGDLVRW